jgi:hypothetical protein
VQYIERTNERFGNWFAPALGITRQFADTWPRGEGIFAIASLPFLYAIRVIRHRHHDHDHDHDPRVPRFIIWVSGLLFHSMEGSEFLCVCSVTVKFANTVRRLLATNGWSRLPGPFNSVRVPCPPPVASKYLCRSVSIETFERVGEKQQRPDSDWHWHGGGPGTVYNNKH